MNCHGSEDDCEGGEWWLDTIETSKERQALYNLIQEKWGREKEVKLARIRWEGEKGWEKRAAWKECKRVHLKWERDIEDGRRKQGAQWVTTGAEEETGDLMLKSYEYE